MGSAAVPCPSAAYREPVGSYPSRPCRLSSCCWLPLRFRLAVHPPPRRFGDDEQHGARAPAPAPELHRHDAGLELRRRLALDFFGQRREVCEAHPLHELALRDRRVRDDVESFAGDSPEAPATEERRHVALELLPGVVAHHAVSSSASLIRSSTSALAHLAARGPFQRRDRPEGCGRMTPPPPFSSTLQNGTKARPCAAATLAPSRTRYSAVSWSAASRARGADQRSPTRRLQRSNVRKYSGMDMPRMCRHSRAPAQPGGAG